MMTRQKMRRKRMTGQLKWELTRKCLFLKMRLILCLNLVPVTCMINDSDIQLTDAALLLCRIFSREFVFAPVSDPS